MLKKVYRQWGYYIVLVNLYFFKIKLLKFSPYKALSIQRHKYRNELWFIFGKKCIGYLNYQRIKNPRIFYIKSGDIHSFCTFSKSVMAIELQFGSKVCESDIERFN